jgi:hypothetical protein
MESSTSITFLPSNSRRWVELLAHGLLALLLPGHDEGAADVAVLDESLAVLDAQALGQGQRRGAAAVRDGDDHVDVVVGRSRWILRASFSPMRERVLYTEISSIIESGRAK